MHLISNSSAKQAFVWWHACS